MANVFVNEDSLSDIADAIRSKLNVQTTYKPGEMAAAIESISGGGITPTGTKSITANGTYDVTSYASAEVNVSGSSPSGTKSITANGTGIDVAAYAYADVAVPNTYSAGDEGKVVSNGALVAQGSDTVTTNGTVDTTLISSLLVNVAGGGSTGLVYETGTFTPAENIARAEISFANSHDKPPMMLMMVDATNDGTDGFIDNTNYLFLYMDYWRAFGTTYPASSSATQYAEVIYKSKGTGTANPSYVGYSFTTANSDNTTDNAAQYSRYWVSYDKFHPYCNNGSRYWRSGRTYKWYAVWKPTT